MAGLQKLIGWALGTAGALIMLATQVSAEDAKSNLESWAKLLGFKSWADAMPASADAWGLIVGIALVAVGAGFLILRVATKRRGVSGARQAAPDFGISDAFHHLMYRSKWGLARKYVGKIIDQTEIELRDAARLGLIQIWGREYHWQIPLAVYSIAPLEPEYWAVADLLWMYCLDGDGRTQPRDGKARTYAGLKTNRAQIEERWPTASLFARIARRIEVWRYRRALAGKADAPKPPTTISAPTGATKSAETICTQFEPDATPEKAADNKVPALALEDARFAFTAHHDDRLEKGELTIKVTNKTLVTLKECLVIVESIRTDDDFAQSVNYAFRPGPFSLGPSESRSMIIATRDLKDIVANPPWLLKFTGSDRPLPDNHRYFLGLVLQSEYRYPTKTSLQLLVAEGNFVRATILDQAV